MADRYFKTQGIVLRTYKLGEADKIAVIYTQDYGKLRATIKGIRKPTSKFGAVIEPASLIEFYLYKTNRELQKVIQAVSVDNFATIKADLDRLTEAFAILETVDKASEDMNPDIEVFTMLHNVLKWLNTCNKNIRLIFPAFCLKLLSIEGAGLVTQYCVYCNQNTELVAFELNEHGFSCDKCKKSKRVANSTIKAVQQVFNGNLRSLLESDNQLDVKQFESIAITSIEQYLGAQIKSIKKSATIV